MLRIAAIRVSWRGVSNADSISATCPFEAAISGSITSRPASVKVRTRSRRSLSAGRRSIKPAALNFLIMRLR